MSSIYIEGVGKRYGDVEVLSDITLTVPHGAVLALLGPSGCGKTTLLRLIAGFDRLDEGSIAFDDRIVASPRVYAPPERRGIGYVPQEAALFPHLTVARNIAYGLPRGSHRKARVQEVLDLIGLPELEARFPHELSGGQQQRVALARALAPHPALILLDEPFNALDLDLRRSVCADVVSVLRKTGTTAVLVTHDPGEAFTVADLVAVMRKGHVIQCAPPAVVYWRPQSPAIARLTGASIFVNADCAGDTAVSALGVLSLHPESAPCHGKVKLMIRPEQITLAAAGHGQPARVIHSSFRGDHTLLNLQLGDLKFGLRTSSMQAPPSGAEVYLSVQGHCMAFPVNEDGSALAEGRVAEQPIGA
jgi:iron(III) transport system ATP-binding protein